MSTWIASLIGYVFQATYNISPTLFGAILSGFWQILVMFGLHWSVVPIGLIQLAEEGATPIFAFSGLTSFAVLGVLLAVLVKTKDKKLKGLSIPASVSALFGITEPALYGILLPVRRTFINALIASAIGGAYTGYFNVVAYRLGGSGIFALPSYIPDSGEINANFWHRIITFVLVTAIGFILTMMTDISKAKTHKKA
nr:PTS transporter subunit EIIC [Atopobacter phocae]